MLRGSSLKITQWVYGIVVYTGNETKIIWNQKKTKNLKKSRMDVWLNYMILSVIIL